MTKEEEYFCDAVVTRAFVTGIVVGVILGAVFTAAVLAAIFL